MAPRGWRYAALSALVVASTLVAASPAAAAIPDGTGWSAGFQFKTAKAASFNVHLPIGQATGTARWNGAHTAVTVQLAVRHNALRAPCVTGTVTDNPSDGINPDVTVATATQCVAGTVTVTGTETPIGRYVVSLCAGAACNYVVVDMVAASAQHLTSGSWKYVSPTQANFSMRLPVASFKGTITTLVNDRAVLGTVKRVNAPVGTCASGEELGANYEVTTCNNIPATFTLTVAGEVKLGLIYTIPVAPGFVQLNMYVSVPQII